MESFTHKKITWTNIKKPQLKDIEYPKKKYGVHPLVVSELYHPTFHPKVDVYDDHAFMVMRCPHYDSRSKKIVAREVDIILTPNELITYQYGKFDVFEKIFKDAKKKPEEFIGKNPAFVLYKVFKGISDDLFLQIDHINKRVDNIEENIFDKGNRELLRDISLVRRDAIDFRRIIKPNIDVLNHSSVELTKIFNKDIKPYFKNLEFHYTRLSNSMDTQIETLQVLHDTNEAIVSEGTNNIIKTLTLFSVIVFPLTLFAAIWGMNTENNPILGRPNDFWIVMLMMSISTMLMLIVFKTKRWL